MSDCIISDQRTFVKNQLKELREFVENSHIEYEEVHFERLYEFLRDACGSIKLRPFTTQATHHHIGVKWTFDTGYVDVMFGPGNDWAWEAHEKEIIKSAKEGGDAGFEVTYKHAGECSFILSGEHYYHLPEEVEDMISLPDDFEGEYTPMLKSYNYEVVWVTNKHDGMLSGYLRKDGKLHYFDNVEETEFKRRRMFAVYELSLFERLSAWRQYHMWHVALASRPVWNFYWWIRKFSKHTPVDQYWEAQDKFKRDHTVVGYFEG